MMSPDEAIKVLRSLQDWLYFSSMNGGTRIQRGDRYSYSCSGGEGA